MTWLEPACALTRANGDLTAGHVSASFLEAGLSIPLIKDGKLRALAVSASAAVSEAAGAPDYEGVSWHMLLMPSKTPRPIAERLHTEMKRIMAAPDMREKIAAVGLIPNDAVDRGDARLHRVRAREMGRAGQAARSRGLAIGPGGREDCGECCSGRGRRDGTRRSCWFRMANVSDGGTCKLLQECRKTFREGLFI